MLTLIDCSSPENKKNLIAEFQPASQSWIVSDLQSKWHLQRMLLEKHEAIEDRAVLRATELWRDLAKRSRPELKMISSELAQTLFWSWIEPRRLAWAQSPQAVQVVIEQMGQWMSIFADPQYPQVMSQWFKDNPEAYVRWGHWFELCSEIWQRCEEQNIMMLSWLPAVLLSGDVESLNLERQLTFDLGPQVSLVEALLIKELARQHDVTVICPRAEWMSMMQGPMQAYRDVFGYELEKFNEDWQPQIRPEYSFRRFSTQLAEVKDAVAFVRRSLDAGTPMHQIAIIAPDIEEVWPALRLFLEQEGIPSNKPQVSSLGGFLEMASWASQLRTVERKISTQDLEMQLFGDNLSPRISFDEFKVLFTNIYGPQDLARAKELFDVSGALPPDQPLGLLEFLTWSLQYWRCGVSTERLLRFLQVVGQETPKNVRMTPSLWLSYFDGMLARRDFTIQPAASQGVWCVSLSSANWLEISHAVVINLCENRLRQLQNSQVQAGEAIKIWNDTGFAITHTDRQELEFDLLWMLERSWQSVRLSFSETDFSGTVLTPSRLWMWLGIVNEQWHKAPQIPEATRWDEIQKLPRTEWARLREIADPHLEGVDLGLRRDVNVQISTWKPLAGVRVSASSLERYEDCPFIFASTRLFKLLDEPSLDMDLDHRTRGLFLHAILEAILRLPNLKWDMSTQEIEVLVDTVREQTGVPMGEEGLWSAVRAQHIRLAERFLQMEKSWRERFPKTQTVGLETEFQCHWDLAEAKPVSEPTPIFFSGRLDRVDQDSQGRYALIDYKASSQNLRNWASWIGAQDLQMPLYAMLLELGLTTLPAGPVAASNFYVVKEQDRRKGYHLKVQSAELYSLEDKHRNWITEEQKQGLFNELRELLQSILSRIMTGDFKPTPKQLRTCDSCKWRTLCRAPHLN